MSTLMRPTCLTACLGLLASTMLAPVAVAAPAPQPSASVGQDLVIAVDTTGMSAEDFRLAQRGIAGLVADTSLPRGGSVSIAVVQFRNDAGGDNSGQAARVSVPLTVVEGEATVQAILSAIRTSRLMEPGATVGKGAIETAAGLVAGRSTASTLGIIALTPPPEGLDPTKDREAARRLGVDEVTVLGIDGREGISEYFSSTILGKGSLSLGSSLSDVLDQLRTAFLGPDLTLRALEVTQVIQDWNNSIPLIADKTTMVRAFLRGPTSTPVTARLWGYRNGAPLPESPLTPANIIPFFPSDNPVAGRANLWESLNFSLPDTWVYGDVTLRLDYPGSLTCTEAPQVDASCSTRVTFMATEQPDIDFFDIAYVQAGRTVRPTTAEMWEQMMRVREQLPVADITFRFRTLAPSFAPTTRMLSDVNTSLLNVAAQTNCATGIGRPCLKKYLGVLAEYVNGNYGGLATGIPGTVASGFMQSTAGILDTGYLRNVGVHEIAHTLGGAHIVNDSVNGVSIYNPGTYHEFTLEKGWCGEEAVPPAPDHPWFSTIDMLDGTTKQLPTLGPMGDPDTEVWGAYPRSIRWNSNLTISDPKKVFPLMSYCEGIGGREYTWMSEPTYRQLIAELGGEFAAGGSSRVASSSTDAAGASLGQVLVRGVADLVEPSDSALGGAVPMDSYSPINVDSSGPWRLELLDSTGGLLDERRFAMAPSEYSPANGEPVPGPTREPFAIAFDDDGLLEDLATVHLLHDEEVVATLQASPETPTVRLLSPTSGAQVSGEALTVNWTARDGDGDPLSAEVQYRTGRLEEWEPIATDVTGESVTIPRDRISASARAEIRVIVTDGLRWSIAESRPFTVANNRPLLAADPLLARFPVTASQSLGLRADAWDAEDGDIGSYITWMSDRDGNIGTGAAPQILATDLSEGRHRITAVVEDSDGSTTRTFVGTVRTQYVAYDFASGAPGKVVGARAVQTGNRLVISWKPPRETGSSPIAGYSYSVNKGAPQSTTATRIMLPLPKRGATTTVSISARNASGLGGRVRVTYRRP